jgi:hypothetical protein
MHAPVPKSGARPKKYHFRSTLPTIRVHTNLNCYKKCNSKMENKTVSHLRRDCSMGKLQHGNTIYKYVMFWTCCRLSIRKHLLFPKACKYLYVFVAWYCVRTFPSHGIVCSRFYVITLNVVRNMYATKCVCVRVNVLQMGGPPTHPSF